MRRAARRDIAEPDIVDALRRVGAEITLISSPDAPDILSLFQGRWMPLGVKTPKIGRLTKGEKKGVKWPLVKTPEEALRAIGACR